MANALTEVPWIQLDDGREVTPLEALNSADSVNLATNGPGYVFGAELRFLMTIAPLLCNESRREPFAPQTIAAVVERLAPTAELFDLENPFLQIPESGGEKLYPASKLYPFGASEEQAAFWNMEGSEQQIMDLQEAVRALVIAYFYLPGTNTKLRGEKLTNGSSGLRYKSSVEIIASGQSLRDMLLFNTPRSFLTKSKSGDLLPHWADRAGDKSQGDSAGTPLWNFSWSSNTLFCSWDEDRGKLIGVVRGGIPESWKKLIPRESEDNWGKSFHDARSLDDPLYFYTFKGDGERVMQRLRIATEPYYAVARWNSETLSTVLDGKWQRSLKYPSSRLANIIFLCHETGGTALSFSIRSSRLVIGWRDELMPEGDDADLERLQVHCDALLGMNRKLKGIFTKRGTCSHIENRQPDVELAFWREMQSLVLKIVRAEMSSEQVEGEIVSGALRAFDEVSSERNTVHIDRHLKARRMISQFFYRKETQPA